MALTEQDSWSQGPVCSPGGHKRGAKGPPPPDIAGCWVWARLPQSFRLHFCWKWGERCGALPETWQNQAGAPAAVSPRSLLLGADQICLHVLRKWRTVEIGTPPRPLWNTFENNLKQNGGKRTRLPPGPVTHLESWF